MMTARANNSNRRPVVSVDGGSFCHLLWVALLLLVLPQALVADEPVHWRIDELVAEGNAEFVARTAPRSGDAEFIRRIFLDLVGTIPTAGEVSIFLSDPDFDKRTRLIDRLLDDPRHARRLQYVFDAMLMERRPDKNIPSKDWREYLRLSFLENKPLDQLVREILSADGADPKLRPAAKFVLDRNLDVDLITRDIGRIFLGRDMQCAQCHDHPSVDDYLQRHYFGITAFFKRSYLFTDPKTKQVSIGEKAEGEVTFVSVFSDEKGKTGPRMLDLPGIADPPPAKKLYVVKPDKKARAVPVYSRRLKLAAAMTDPSNVAFRRNMANRLWALMMGRGLVEPLDMWHSDNPPSNPKLLNLLAGELLDSGYDVRHLLRQLALSKTYQRSSRLPDGVKPLPADRFAAAILKPLSPEQLANAMMQATGLIDTTLPGIKQKLEKDKNSAADDSNKSLQIERALDAALAGNVNLFVATFAPAGVQSSGFDPSADQALFLRNGTVLQDWLKPAGGNLGDRLLRLDDSQRIAVELYLSILSRSPTEEEAQEVKNYLIACGDDRAAGLRDLAWAVLTSAEFRFNH